MVVEQTDETEGVFVEKNHIYIYGELDYKLAMMICKELQRMHGSLKKGKRIVVHLLCEGGAVYGGLAVAQNMMALPRKTVAIVDASACSSATVIWLGADRRYVRKYSEVLIHQPRIEVSGTYAELSDHQRSHDLVFENCVGFYAERTGLKRSKVKQLLKKESWLTPQACVAMGFAHKIV